MNVIPSLKILKNFIVTSVSNMEKFWFIRHRSIWSTVYRGSYMPETASRPYRNSLTGRRVMRSIDVPLQTACFSRDPASFWATILSRGGDTPLHEIFALLRNRKRKREIGISFLLLARGVANLLNFYTIREKLFRFFRRFVPLPRENKSLGNSKINYKIYKREKKRENHWKPFPCRSIILSVPKFGRGEEEEKERTANNRA